MSTPDYYNKGGAESIDKMEAIANALQNRGLHAVKISNIFLGLKYYDRMDLKYGENAIDDIGKCADYLYRAVEGRWPWEGSEDVGIAD